MAINRTTTFGSRFNNNPGNLASGASQSERPKAKFWMNIGYCTNDPKYPFVSLSNGIPLDPSDLHEIRGSAEYANFLSAQNQLLKDVMAQAETLEPGQDMIFESADMPLAIQLRHVRDQQTEVAPDQNPLARRNLFGGVTTQQESNEQPAAE